MPSDLLIGLDLGTTTAKASVYAVDGTKVAEGRAATPWGTHARGVEAEATDIRDSAFRALAAAAESAPAGTIRAVGVASIAESGVYLDRDGESVAPVIAWHDKRDRLELEDLDRDLGAREFSGRTGLPFRQQWSITKSRWIDRHVPGSRRAVTRMNIAEWIVHSLGGRATSEPSLSARTGWFDVEANAWWAEGVAFAGLRADVFPPLAECGERLGEAGAGVHPRLRGAALTVAGHDHQAAAAGLEMWSDGDVFDSCGTAEALVRTASRGLGRDDLLRLTDAGMTVGPHALPGRLCVLGGTEGGLQLGRVLRILGVDDLRDGLDEAARASSGSLSIEFDGGGRAAIAGLGDDASPAALWRAAVEAVTDDADRLARCMTEVVGPNRRVVAAGGWTASATLMDAKRRRWGDVLMVPDTEAGSRGAALFAGVAGGLWSSVETSSFVPIGAVR
ncbi:FGGY-family carbohydrate kinase [Agromyces aerolatus]|uniref:FGGY-family carbohydrate kinase n=1 Tax=Agromyces sp. LY-1074 TaxID=3074080 RepID=UPI002859F512|nr:MULTISPECIES: FGGY family carbohydrate kinase [unclassified Agromyces]MDR5700890.1 FGGY family carbohydrate kinase [Agromyces sp. LY-1074]MDR5707449.1 FGGY family carbohydrate kinase [Agromyces sp. LY-1358]